MLDMDWSKIVFEKADLYHEDFTKQLKEYEPVLEELHIQEGQGLLLPQEKLNFYPDILSFKRLLDKFQEERVLVQQLVGQYKVVELLAKEDMKA